jgi:hypothetical protein
MMFEFIFTTFFFFLLVFLAGLFFSSAIFNVTANDEKELLRYVRKLAQRAKIEKRKHLTLEDRKLITHYAGKNDWSELDVLTIFNEWQKVIYK